MKLYPPHQNAPKESLEKAKIEISYFRFLFNCGCEFLTWGMEELLVREGSAAVGELWQTPQRQTCPFHRISDYVLFAMNEKGYWVPLKATAHHLYRPWIEIPVSRGRHPDKDQVPAPVAMDARDLAHWEEEKAWNRINFIALSLFTMANPPADLSKEDREMYEKAIKEADPDMLGEAQTAVMRYAKYMNIFRESKATDAATAGSD